MTPGQCKGCCFLPFTVSSDIDEVYLSLRICQGFLAPLALEHAEEKKIHFWLKSSVLKSSSAPLNPSRNSFQVGVKVFRGFIIGKIGYLQGVVGKYLV